MQLQSQRLGPRLIGPHQPQTRRLRTGRKVQIGRVLHHQHHRMTHHPLHRAFPVRGQHRFRMQAVAGVVDEIVVPLGGVPVPSGGLQIRGVRMIGPVFHDAD